jgi:hypothetical protein
MAKLPESEYKQAPPSRRIFYRAALWAGVALLAILIAAVFLARPAAKKIQPITPKGRSGLRVLQARRFG